MRAAQSGSLAAANAALSCYIIACARTLADDSGIAPPPLRPQDAGEGAPKRGAGAAVARKRGPNFVGDQTAKAAVAAGGPVRPRRRA